MSLFSESTPTIVVLIAVTAGAGLVRGFAGFGAGLVMAPVFIYLLGPRVAVPLIVILDLAASIQLLPSAFRKTRWKTVLPLGISAALMIPLGSLALISLPRAMLLKIVSGIVLVFVGVLSTGWRYRSMPKLPVTTGAGIASGFLTGMAGIGGPPIILFLLSGPDSARENRAGFISFFAMSQLVALTTFTAGGLVTPAIVPWVLILTPVFLISILAGSRLFSAANEMIYRRVALVFLAGVALAGLLLN